MSWSATIVGLAALRRGGLTRVPGAMTVALHPGDDGPVPAGLGATRRSADWFVAVLPGLVRPRPPGELFTLRAPWALADMIVQGEPPPADLDVSRLDGPDFATARAALGVRLS